MFAAGRTGNLLLLDKLLHLLLREGVNRLVQRDAILPSIILNEFVCAETLMTLLAVHKRV